jgi:hypothetical protein
VDFSTKLGQIKAKKAAQQAEKENGLGRVYHRLCQEYGFIPLRDFKEMPMYAILTLAGYIHEQDEMQRKQIEEQNARTR